MRGINKVGLAVLLTSVALGLGAPKNARANNFPSQKPIVEYNDQQAMDYLYGLCLPNIIDSLNQKITEYRQILQFAEDKYPGLTFISRILSPNEFSTDRIGDQPNLTGGDATPTTAITSILDLLDIDTSGVVNGVRLKSNYREMAVKMFGRNEVFELEIALSKLFSNAIDAYRVIYEGPDGSVQSAQEPNPVPDWINSLDGKHVYMLVKIVMAVYGLTPEGVDNYKKDLDSTYKEILYSTLQYKCATEALFLAEWLSEYGNDPNIPDEIKQQKYNELRELLKQVEIYI